nr:hypothetical protein [uncultured Blautia sp.]
MTALLEIKQKIKNFYGQYEIYLMPVLKFVLAFVYFLWINANMGYMKQLDNIFIIVILALICSILPTSVMIFVGFALMIGHCYAVGIETAGFMLVLVLFMLILFLRFSSSQNVVLVLTPLSFGFSVPALLPIGAGLLGTAVSALPAGCGVVIYYFIRFVKQQSAVLGSADVEAAQKLKLIADGLVQNWGMWITVIAFVIVVLIVNLLRTRAFDYAWRIAIIAGGVVYILVMLAGDFCLNVQLDMVSLILYTVISVVVGIILEFFVFGGDYSRTERLEYEDDEYYYYVKAVPKAAVTTSERSIKKINGDSSRGDRKAEDDVVTIGSGFDGPGHRRAARNAAKKKTAPSVKEKKEVKETAPEQPPMRKTPEVDKIDFEKKLEESLKDL